MKKFVFSLMMILILSSLLFSSTANASKRVYVNEYVTAVVNGDPCKLHVSGWVDLDVVWGFPPVEITHYNLTIEGPCGKWKFEGSVVPNNEIIDGQLYDEMGNPIPLDPNIIDIEYILLTITNNIKEG